MPLYFLLALSDGILTYINTPDLSMEGNPLVLNLGLGWGALIVANVLVFIFVFGLAYYSFFKYKTVYTEEITFSAYCSQIVYDRPDQFWEPRLPKHITPYLASLGFAIPYATVAGRIITVTEWLLITFRVEGSYRYFAFRSTYLFGRIDAFVAIIIAVTLMLLWFKMEFKKQLKAS